MRFDGSAHLNLVARNESDHSARGDANLPKVAPGHEDELSADVAPSSEHFGGREGASNVPPSWLDDAWLALPERSREVLRRRLSGDTLDGVGQDLGVTRERVRQLESDGRERLLEQQRIHDGGLPARLQELGVERVVITEEEVAGAVGGTSSAPRWVILKGLGMVHPVVAGRRRPDLWTFDRDALNGQLEALVSVTPCSDEEAREAAREIGIPGGFDWQAMLATEIGTLTRHRLGWVRTRKAPRDIAYLWLRREGEPRTLVEIAAAAGLDGQRSRHALGERLRRDEAFAQVRPEGTWALADWRVPGTEGRYGSALDVVVEVVRDLGPMTAAQLQTESRLRYPVSDWRIQHCLSSNLIGLNEDGLFDLAERGAKPVEDEEPSQPSQIEVSGSIVGVALRVNRDLMRGSALPVHRWLTWYLGLRTATASRHFALPGALGEITIRRGLGNMTVSSLRVPAASLGVVEGCALTLLLRTDGDTADLLHVCGIGNCRSPTEVLARLPP